MRSIASDDFYELRLMAKLGEAGFASLTDLYLPLIGANALGLYLALYAEAEEGEALATHEALFLKTGLTPGQFGNALAPLEAVGLIRTFQHQAPEKHNIYSYCVYAPSSPSFFLDDILFAGALAKALGEAAFMKIKSKYALPALPTDGKEVSVSFKEYFNPDLDEPVFAQSRFAAVGDGPAKLALSFSEPAFL
ncbi:MAG: hypothetical protein HUJ60_06330, partial [Bacilli bacterium]|nr:hypothetical protein [Bacilli bacterium]